MRFCIKKGIDNVNYNQTGNTMPLFKTLAVRELTPTLSLFVDRYKHGEITPCEFVSADNGLLESSLSLVLNGLQPSVVLKEQENGYWEFLSGDKFLLILIEFADGKSTYPVNGEVKELQGKSFSCLSPNQKKQLQNVVINIHLQRHSATEEQQRKLEQLVIIKKHLS